MTNSEVINPGIPVAGPYSPGIKVGNLLFISGQSPAPGTENIKDQTLTTLENIKKIVEATGGRVSNIINTTVFLKSIKDFSEMNKIYQKFFDDHHIGSKYPARTTVEVSNLPVPTMLIEINAIANLS